MTFKLIYLYLAHMLSQGHFKVSGFRYQILFFLAHCTDVVVNPIPPLRKSA